MAHLPSSPDVDDRITTWCDVASEMRPMAIAHKSKAQDMPAVHGTQSGGSSGYSPEVMRFLWYARAAAHPGGVGTKVMRVQWYARKKIRVIGAG